MRINYTLRTACMSLLLIVTSLFGINRSASAEANYVYHEATTNNPGCGPNYLSVLTPNSSQALTVAWKVEYQFYTDNVRLYYTTDGSTPSGAFGVGSGTTQVIVGSYNCTFGAPLVDVATATIPAQPAGTTVKYIVSAWHSGGGDEIFANGPGAPCACGPVTNNSSLATVFTYTVINSAVEVTSSGGTAPSAGYTSIAAAVTAINGGVLHTGTITANVLAGHIETSTGVISLTATGTLSNPITIQKSGSGANPKIISYTGGIGTPGSAAQDGIFNLIGSDYVTIDGIDLEENAANTTNPSTMEYGYGMFKASATDGCQNNTIQNCTITLNRINNATGGTLAVDGSRGINIVNALVTTQTTVVTVTSASGANSNNKIYTNTIQNCNIGIAIIGFADATPFTNADQNNDIGGSSSSTGNQILNYGGATGATNPAAAVRTLAQYGLNVSYNTINNNNGSGVNHATTLRGIYTNTATSASETISNNTITIKGGGTTSQITGIENVAGSTAAGNTVSINNNSITTEYTTATSGVSYGIYNNGATPATLNVNGNTFSMSTAATSGSLYPIFQAGSVVTTVNTNNNNISSISCTASSTSLIFRGIYLSSAASTVNWTASTNNITGVSFTGTHSGAFHFLYNSNTIASENINFNTITNLSIPSSSTIQLIYLSNSTNNVTVNDNSIVTGFSNTTSSSSSFMALYNFGSPSSLTHNVYNNNFSNISINRSAGSTIGSSTGLYGIYWATNVGVTQNVYNNTVSNFTNTGTGMLHGISVQYGSPNNSVYSNTVSNLTSGGAVQGIQAGNSSTTNMDVYSNTISGLTSTGAGTAANGLVIGTTSTGGPSGTMKIYKNKIYNIAANGATGIANGVNFLHAVSPSIYNNLIGGITAPNSTAASAVNGINIASTGSTANVKLYYNTVYLSGTGTGGSSALFVTTIPSSVDVRNNIFVNTTTTSTGFAVAYRRTTTSLTNYASTSNNNLFYAGTPGPSRLIFYDGANSDQTLAAYQARVAPRDAASISENPTWVSTTGSDPNFLHIDTTTPTGIESGGANISGITDDFDGDVRQGNGGYSGTGTAPDIGGDEFELILADCVTAVGGTTSGTTTICAGTSATVTASGYSVGSGSTYQWEYSNDDFASDVHDLTGQNNPSTASTGNLTASTYFRLRVTCGTDASTDYSTPNILVTVNAAPAVTISPDPSNATICGTGSVSLTASATTTPATRTVTVQNIQFTPAAMNVNVGDVIHFVWLDGVHTTTSTSVPLGAASWDADINSGSPTFDYTVTTAGVYNYFCEIHGSSMLGTFTASLPAYTWSPSTGLSSTTGSSVTASPTSTTTYTVTATDAGGCTGTATQTVTVNDAVTNATASASPNPVCVGGTLNLTSSASIAGYTMNSNSGVSFVDISGTGTSVGTISDDSEHNITLPFAFSFNNVSYTTARVGNNGVLVFGATAGDINYSNRSLPAPLGANNTDQATGGLMTNVAGAALTAIVANWDDMTPGTGASIKTQQIGSTYYVQWTNEDNFGATGTGTVTFQIQLEQTTNTITLVYPDISYGVGAPYDNGGSATVGLNFSATSALQYSNLSASLTDGQSITFTPLTLSYSWTGPDSYSSSNQNPTINSVTTNNAGVYTVTATSAAGCTASASTADVVVNSYVTYYADTDNDTYGDPSVSQTTCTGAPTGYVTDNTDCDDTNAAINPGATEVCNTIDDDCDTQIDEGVQSTFYADADNDTYGDPAVSIMACTAPSGYVSNNTDCNDADASVNSLQTYYADTDTDGFGDPASSTTVCSSTPPAGYVSDSSDCDDTQLLYADGDGDTYGAGAPAPCGVADNTDCDDSNAAINPGATEICGNGTDDDCDGTPDDGCTTFTYYADADGDGFGNPAIDTTTTDNTPPAGYVTNNLDCDDTQLLYADGDGDTYGAGAPIACGVANNTDCNDGDASINPGATEACNGVDDDCDGFIDEGVTYTLYYVDADNDTYGSSTDAGTLYCADPGAGYSLNNTDCDDGNAAVNPGATETCNGIDDDCDGNIDNDVTAPTVTVSASCPDMFPGNTSTLTATASAGSGTIVSYQWVLNDTTNVGTNSDTYVTPANAEGSYTVIVTNSNGCSTTSDPVVLTNVPAGALAGGTYDIPSSCGFPTVSAAVNYISANGISGSVVFNVAAGHTETAPVGGVVLNQCSLSSGVRSGPSQTITFQKSGSGSNPLINAFTGLGTVDGIVEIVGAENVTFDGIDVSEVIGNTTSTQRMEWGYAILKCSGNDGANNNIIKNAVITLNKANTSSAGIYSGNHTNVNTTGLTYSGGTGNEDASRNGRNVFFGNTISNVYFGVSLNGNASSSGSVSLNDTLNQIGVIGEAVNSITNFGGSTVATAAIIETNQRGINVNNNSINGGTGTTGPVTGISMISGVWGQIRNNTITLASSATTSANNMIGITCGFSGGSATNPNLVKITGNTIQNINWTTGTTATFTGITFTGGGTGSIDSISNNSVINNTTAGTTGSFVGVASTSSAASVTMSGNLVSGNTLLVSTSARQFNSVISTGLPASLNMNGNTVTNNTNFGVGQITGITSSGAAANATISNNTVSNNTVTGGALASSVFAINTLGVTYVASNNTILNNRVNNMTGTAVGSVIGINVNSTSILNATITNNTIRKLFVGGTSTGLHLLRGISDAAGATATKTVSGNQIDSLYTASTIPGGAFIGILSSTGGPVQVTKNRITNLILNGNGATGTVVGIQCSAGSSVGISNNYIGDLYAPASTNPTNAISGFTLSSTTASSAVGFHYNTIRLSSGGGANFGTSGVSVTSTTPVFTMRNNIIVNVSTPGSTSGFTVAYRRSTTGFTNYSTASNNNLFYAGVPATNALIHYDGTNSYQTLAAYQAAAATRDQASVTEDVPFASITPGTSNYLHINPSVPTQVESGGTPIAGITTDYDGDTRSTISPDIGADEGDFTNATPIFTSVSANPSTGQCTAVSHEVTAEVVPGPDPITSVTLNYAYDGNAQTPIAMVNVSGNTWTATIPAASPDNATVTWSVTATDGIYTKTVTGTPYQDAYLTGVTATASASPSTICEGASSQLSVNAPGTATIGTGTLTNTTTTYPTPYGQWYGSTQEQYLITAAELSAAGLVAGNLTGLAFNLAAGYSYAPLQNYQIQIAHTSQSALTTTLITTGFTSVYGPTTYTPPNATGFAATNFTTPFTWDGVSNIVVDVWFSNCSVCNGTSSCTTSFTNNGVVYQTATSFASTVDYHADNNCTVNSFAPSFSGTLYNQRPNIRFNGITGPSGFASITWSDGVDTVGSGASVSVTPSSSTTYTATLTDANGCSVTSSSATVTVLSLPAEPTATNSTQCGTGVPTASVTGAGGTFKWYLVSSGGTPLAGETGNQLVSYSISTTTTFYVSEFNGTCEGPRAAVTATVNTPDTVTASASSPACLGGTIDLTATQTGSTNTYTFTWTASPSAGSGISGSITGQSVTVTPTEAGSYTYTVTAYDSSLDCTAISSVNVTVTAPPVITSATASPDSSCTGSDVTLTALTGTTSPYMATVGTGTVQNTTTTYPAPYGNWYWGDREQMLIRASELTAAGLTAGNIYSLAFNVVSNSGNANYTNFEIGVKMTTASAVTLTFDPSGFTTVVTGPYTVTTGWNTHTFSTPFYWDGTSNLLINTCSFINGGFTSNAIFNQTATSFAATVDYHQDGSNAACSALTGQLTYNQRPNMQIVGTQNTEGAGSYAWQWNPGALNGNIVTVNPTVNTTYTVTATDTPSQCTSTQTVDVAVIALPASPTATPSTQCGYGVPTASVSGAGSSFRWYLESSGGTALAGETGNQLSSYAISSTTTFYVSEFNGTCESPRVDVVANVTQPDSVSASHSTPTCLGSAISLDATQTGSTNTYTFEWTASPSSGSGISGSASGQSISVTPTESETFVYTVTAYDSAAACTYVASTTVTVTPIPVINSVSATPNNICSGGTTTLSAQSGTGGPGTVTVGTGATTTQAGSPFRAGGGAAMRTQFLFTASELAAAGLSAGNLTSISYNFTTGSGGTLPNYTISIGNTSVTALTSTFQTTSLTSVYGPASVNPPTGTGPFGLTFSTPFFWDGTSNIIVQVCHDNPNPTAGSGFVSATTTSFISVVQAINSLGCATTTGTTQTLRPDATIGGQVGVNNTSSFNWVWNPGNMSGSTVTASPPDGTTTYTVTATDPLSGCTASATTTVNTGTPLVVSVNSTTICAGQSSTLTATVSGGGFPYTYSWSPGGATSASITVAPSSTTTYTVTVGDNCSNSSNATGTVNVNALPVVTITPNNPTICPGGSGVVLTAAGANTYSWSPAAGLSATTGDSVTATPTVTTNYVVTGTDVNGCSSTGSATVILSPAMSITVTATPDTICGGGSSSLNASVAMATSPASAYTLSNLTGQTYTTLTGGGITVINTASQLTSGMGTTNQDDGGVVITLPFTFTYLGTNFTQMSMCTNGWVGAGNWGTIDAVSMRIAGNLFTSTIPNNTIAAWFKDMGANFGAGFPGSMRHGLIGTDVYAFQWDQAVGNSFSNTTTNLISFQINIYGPASSAPGRIEYIYGPTAGTIAFAASIGIEDATGGTNHYLNALTGNGTSTTTSSAWPGNGNGYRFNPIPATGLAYSWSPSAYLNDSTISNPVASGVPTTTSFSVTATNSAGCTISGSVTVNVVATDATFTGLDPDYCADAGAVLLTPVQPGGVFSGPGVIPFGADYYFDPSTSGVGGPFEIVYTTMCASDTQTTSVHSLPVVTLDSFPPICVDAPPLELTGGSPAGGFYFDSFGYVDGTYFYPAAAGVGVHTIYYAYADSFGCASLAQQDIVVEPAATVDAGPDQTICSVSDATLSGSFGGSATSVTWTTSGDGTFADASDPATTYSPGLADQLSGSVTLTLTTNDPAGACGPDSDDVVITLSLAVAYYPDLDDDGYGAGVPVVTCVQPTGTSTNNLDCDDTDPAVNPGMAEACGNGIDDNCDGQVDENCTVYTYYADVDGDTYGNPADTVTSLSNTPPPGYVSDNTDCNDSDASINPGAADVCNGIDDNCNGQVDENAIVATVSPSGTVTYCRLEPVTLTTNAEEGLSYQWYRNGVPQSGATNSTFTTTKRGNFSVSITNGLCADTSVATTISRLPIPQANITVYGNTDICSAGSVLLRANKAQNNEHSYQWNKGGLPVSGATDRLYTATSTGEYTVTLTNDNGCSTTSSPVTVTSSCKGSQPPALFSAELNLYPNPNHGNFVVELQFSDDVNSEADVMLINTLGQTIYLNRTAVVNGKLFEEVKLDYGVAAGNYFVKVIVGDKVYTGQIVYQK